MTLEAYNVPLLPFSFGKFFPGLEKVLKCDNFYINIMPDFHGDSKVLTLSFDTPIFQKTYELYKEFHRHQVNLPRMERYTLGLRCENAILDLLEAFIAASQQTKAEKLPTLQKASIKLDMTKVFIRLCKDIKIIDNKNYLAIESSLQEIGRMLGG